MLFLATFLHVYDIHYSLRSLINFKFSIVIVILDLSFVVLR